MMTLRKILPSALAVLAGSAPFATAAAPGDPDRGPAPSLARPASAEKAPDADGFMPRWLILEPIPVSGRLTDPPFRRPSKKSTSPTNSPSFRTTATP
jgi:hypothetical protein